MSSISRFSFSAPPTCHQHLNDQALLINIGEIALASVMMLGGVIPPLVANVIQKSSCVSAR